MPEETTWWVTFHNDYPGPDGPMHAYFANADCGETMIRLKVISSHPADGCLIDHQSRISDVDIPNDFKLELAIHHWRSEKVNQ